MFCIRKRENPSEGVRVGSLERMEYTQPVHVSESSFYASISEDLTNNSVKHVQNIKRLSAVESSAYEYDYVTSSMITDDERETGKRNTSNHRLTAAD